MEKKICVPEIQDMCKLMKAESILKKTLYVSDIISLLPFLLC